MIKKLFQNQAERAKKESWSLSQDNFSKAFFYLLLLFLPTQLGKHFWPQSSFVFGLRLDYLSPTIYLTDILIFLIFIFSLKTIFNSLKKIKREYKILFLVFISSICLGTFFSKNPQAGFLSIIKILELSFLSFYVIENINKLNKKIIFFVITAALLFESFLAIFQYINQSSINGLFYFLGERTFSAQSPGVANASINGQLIMRPYATFSHPNVLAGFLIFSMLSLFIFYTKFKYSKLILTSGILIGTSCLILTLSRLSILLWLIYLIVLFGTPMVKKYKKKISNAKIILSFTALMLFIFLFFIFFQNSIFLQRFYETKLSDESIVQRQELVNQSLRMFSDSPFLGVGINNFYNNLSLVDSSEKTVLIQPVHNIFFLTLSETGILGIAFLMFLLYKAIRQSLYKENKIMFMLLGAVLAIGMIDHYFLTLQQGQIMLSLVIGTALAYKNT